MNEPRYLEEAERAERAGEPAAAATALRSHLALHPDDRAVRLRFGRLLMSSGERGAARQAFELLETPMGDLIAREATRRLAELDEAAGAIVAASARWERILVDDIDDPQARARLALLRPVTAAAPLDHSQTLAAPEGIETSRYRLVRELGRGATGAVYLARDVALELDVALKVLHPQLAGAARSGARRRFFAEARLAAGLRHSGVVAIYDVDEAARSLTMEHVPGGTLRERLRANPDGLPPDELAETARRLLEALAFVHAHGIAHGDLKPSNLLLRRPGEIVLADFGAAELAGDVRAAASGRAPGGTPLYLAPEQFRGAPSSPATDLFATGAILWEASTGQTLRSHADLLRGEHAAPLSPSAHTRLARHGEAWAALVLKLLSPSPTARAP